MSQWIQGQPTVHSGCTISKLVCSPGMRKLMDCESHNQREDSCNKNRWIQSLQHRFDYTTRASGIIRGTCSQGGEGMIERIGSLVGW
jgi:hypothetical protein